MCAGCVAVLVCSAACVVAVVCARVRVFVCACVCARAAVEKLKEFQAKNPNIRAVDLKAAAEFGRIIVMAVKGMAAEEVMKSLEAHLAGKTVIDTTNPIDDKQAPVAGVLPFFTGVNESLGERLQHIVPSAMVVKAFTCIGSHFMVRITLQSTLCACCC